MKKNLYYRFIMIFGFVCILCSLVTFRRVYSAAELADSGIDYNETTDELNNPERGYMANYSLALSPGNSEVINTNKIFCHLFFQIGSLSDAYNGGKGDKDFTQDMLDALTTTFANLRESGATAIIRFSYDNYDGVKDAEPSMEQIIRHINQLKPIFTANQDVISCVEVGFLGPWGEIHSSKLVTKQNVNALINALLLAVPESRTISARTPRQYTDWLGINIQDIDKNVTKLGTDAFRIGIFNDGYLGSYNDLGTYVNRIKEINWISSQATHTFYGGEVPSVSLDDNNLPSNCLPEMLLTHLTYLNGGEFTSWSQTYRGTNKAYNGLTTKKYIADHMGYRYVLTKSELTKTIKQGAKLNIKLKIDNTGFSNIINEKEVELILLKDNQYYTYNMSSIDVRKWASNTTQTISLSADLAGKIPAGKWDAYIRISNPNAQDKDDLKWTISFANKNIWNNDLCANYLGTFTVINNNSNSNTSSKPRVLHTLIPNMTIDGTLTSKIEYASKDLLYQYASKKVFIKNDDNYLYILVEDAKAQGYEVVEMGFYNEKNKNSYRTYSTSSVATEKSGYVWYGSGIKELEKKKGYTHFFDHGGIEYRIPLGSMFGAKKSVELSNFYIRFMDMSWGDISVINTDQTYTILDGGGSIGGAKITTVRNKAKKK